MDLVEATEDDTDALVERWYALAKGMEAYSELNELVYSAVEEVPTDPFRQQFADDAITNYLVVHDGETIGFCTLQEGDHPSRKYSQSLRIVDLAIDEGHRGQGHGTAVIERVKELARDRGCDHLKVACEWDNEAARRFYRETEFEPKQVEYAQPLE